MTSDPNIIHEDRHIIIVDKPALMPTVDVPGGIPETLVKWLMAYSSKFKKINEKVGDAGLINRIDNETSGIVVAAKNEKSHQKLKELWSSKEISKTYITLAIGEPPPEGMITLIAHHPKKANRMMVVQDSGEAKNLKARYAETHYRELESFYDYALLEVRIVTGLRHQIRCHLASIGHPIAGDKIYRRTKHESRDWLKLPRHFLHASRIRLPHPSSGKVIEYDSPLPADLEGALEQLRK